MKLNTKVVIALIAASASVIGFSSVASAGEGGVAASSSFTLNGYGGVTGGATAAAVGKNDAAATASNYQGLNTASALGSAGAIYLNTSTSTGYNYYDPYYGYYDPYYGSNASTYTSISGSVDYNPYQSQNNGISSYSSSPVGSFGTYGY
ncbi:hypothetical protein [Cylindrospermum sp. FACHB-282]|uniref:hypothetical protein n=1 Tax=Cylindrospermum sp. FACHB-282 TaxID=2692794 RepID=UPI0016825003|nr:hypothetical protein [Cylindrospermum sp. FACHB-282]MBD2388111.1 hypothetical protein [Cylindrospermum sp. FACHB-282]